MSARRILLVFALAAVLAGLTMNVLSLWRAGETQSRLRGKARDLAAVRALAAEADAARATVRVFEAFGDTPPADLRELLAAAAPGLEAEIRPRDPEPVLPGWELHGVDVTLPDVPLEQADAFMLQAESARPPWRVSACAIQSTTRDGGRGRVTIAVESLRPVKVKSAANDGKR